MQQNARETLRGHRPHGNYLLSTTCLPQIMHWKREGGKEGDRVSPVSVPGRMVVHCRLQPAAPASHVPTLSLLPLLLLPFPCPPGLPNPACYKFKDNVMQTKAYDLLLFSERQRLHRVVIRLLDEWLPKLCKWGPRSERYWKREHARHWCGHPCLQGPIRVYRIPLSGAGNREYGTWVKRCGVPEQNSRR